MILPATSAPGDAPTAEDVRRSDGADREIGTLVAPLLDAFRQAWILAHVQRDRARLDLARAWRSTIERALVGGLRAVLALCGALFATLGLRGGLH